MRFRVKDYCRIILYLPTEDKLKSSSYAPQKPKRIDDDVDMRLSEDEAPIETEDAQNSTTNHHRPPSYNPEDYAHALSKYSHATNLYVHDPKDKKNRGKEKDKSSNKDSGVEMTLKQFASLPELLRRLREDLKTAYISFVKELVRDPHDGVSLLLDLLKMIQLAQSNLSGSSTNREQQIALRRTLIDEFECLSCLRCCLRCADAAPRLANYRNGLYCLAAATMSSLTRSRTIALQLMTKACENSVAGHRQVVEAFSTLRLRFAEPVRCKFLVSMMLSYPHPSFQVWGLKMVNALLSSAVSLKERIYLQEELGEAGFDSAAIRKALEHRGAATPEQQEAVRTELDKWNEGYIDLTSLEDQLTSLKSSNMTLKQELQHLRQANMKLLEENVLVKTVGGEVEERCSALKRRLEKHGIPSAPSPTPSVTDSEVSSFVNTDRSTIKRNNSESPTRTMEFSPASTMDTICGPEGERSMSLEWKMIRSPSEGRKLSRVLSQGHQRQGNELIPPVPKKRHILGPQDSASTRSLYVNDYCPNGYKKPKDRGARYSENGSQVPNNESATNTEQNGRPGNNNRTKETMVDVTFIKTPSDMKSNGNISDIKLKSSQDEEHYQSPVKPARPNFRKSPSPKCVNGSGEEKEDVEKNSNKGGRRSSVKSLSSSTSSLSVASSSASLDGGERKDQGDPEYENLPKKDSDKQSTKNNSNNNSNNSSMSHKSTNTEKRTISKSRTSCEEGEIEYERDVVVYEAITLGNDTILYDKNNTGSSNGSKNSNNSNKSDNGSKNSNNSNKSDNGIDGGPCVKQSVQHYENLVNMGEKREETPNVTNGQEEEKGENSKNIFNGLINGLKNHKRRESKSGKEPQQSIKKVEKKETPKDYNDDVSEREVEAVMNGLENILRSAESSMSLGSIGTVKENPLLREHFEDRASPENTVNEIEIVPTRVPQIPPRSRSRGTSSQSSRSRTPDPCVFLESPSETSDTDTFHNTERDPNSMMDGSSTKSFGWVRGDPGIRRRDTFVDRSKNFNRQYGLRRCESVNMNNLKEYNSHRSYSPRRRGSTDHLVPLEESEIQISGRKYTQYTASEVERRNQMNNRITSDMKRRRNRSFDDRLDQWLDEDFQRQQKYPQDIPQESSRHSRRTSSRSNERRVPPPPKPSRNSKSRYSASEVNSFKNGFQHSSNNGLRESDYGPNFMLNSPPNPHRLEEVLNDLVNFSGKTRSGRIPRKMMRHDDPAIPTPDYSATPAGTLTNENLSSGGRHILEIASGLY